MKVGYRTTPTSTALQWLQPEQTLAGTHPFLFSQCQATTIADVPKESFLKTCFLNSMVGNPLSLPAAVPRHPISQGSIHRLNYCTQQTCCTDVSNKARSILYERTQVTLVPTTGRVSPSPLEVIGLSPSGSKR